MYTLWYSASDQFAFYLQVAIKNNVDVFYFACLIPMHVFFTEDGQMDKRLFLSTWKEIPAQNEVQYTISNVTLTAGNSILFSFLFIYLLHIIIFIYFYGVLLNRYNSK